jgi:protein phosphatase PTC7
VDQTDLTLKVTFMAQQQLKSFNRPYQLGYDDPEKYPADIGPPSFDHPLDANVTGYGVRPGDIVIVATDGIVDIHPFFSYN